MHDEHQDILSKELTLTKNQNSRYYPSLTLKDYLDHILSEMRKNVRNKKDEKSLEKTSENIALGIYAVGLIIFAFNIFTKNDDIFGINISVIRFYWWIFAGIYLLICIERSQFFVALWKHSATKYIAGLIFSVLILCSFSTASAELNSIFHVDPSVFPLTRSFITGLIVLNSLTPVLILLGVICVSHMIVLFAYFQSKAEKVDHLKAFLSSAYLLIAIFFSVYTTKLNHKISQNIDLLTYRSAHLLDFNKSNPCKNLDEQKSVIFIGALQNRILIDEVKNYSDGFLESLLSGSGLSFSIFSDERESIPNEFTITDCEIGVSKSDANPL